MRASPPQHSLPVPSPRLGSLLLLRRLPVPSLLGEQRAQRTPMCMPAPCSQASRYLPLLGIADNTTKRSLGGGGASHHVHPRRDPISTCSQDELCPLLIAKWHGQQIAQNLQLPLGCCRVATHVLMLCRTQYLWHIPRGGLPISGCGLQHCAHHKPLKHTETQLLPHIGVWIGDENLPPSLDSVQRLLRWACAPSSPRAPPTSRRQAAPPGALWRLAAAAPRPAARAARSPAGVWTRGAVTFTGWMVRSAITGALLPSSGLQPPTERHVQMV